MDFPNQKDENILEVIKNHRSIRKFLNKKIPDADIRQILSTAQATSTSSHGQNFSIINVTSSEKREKLSQLSGNQKHVKECSHFIVFCADLYRLEQLGKLSNITMEESLHSTEMFLIASVDAALAAQTTAIAAEALGYGIVYTGGIRNNIEEVTDILQLPNKTYPVFGMCIGIPVQNEIPDLKPRLPLDAVMFENEYPDFNETVQYIQEYDEKMRRYYMTRAGQKRTDVTWSQVMIEKRKEPRRQNIKSFLNEKGFLLD